MHIITRVQVDVLHVEEKSIATVELKGKGVQMDNYPLVEIHSQNTHFFTQNRNSIIVMMWLHIFNILIFICDFLCDLWKQVHAFLQ